MCWRFFTPRQQKRASAKHVHRHGSGFSTTSLIWTRDGVVSPIRFCLRMAPRSKFAFTNLAFKSLISVASTFPFFRSKPFRRLISVASLFHFLYPKARLGGLPKHKA